MGMIDGGALNFGVLCKCQDLLLSCCQGNEWPTHGSETLPVGSSKPLAHRWHFSDMGHNPSSLYFPLPGVRSFF